MLRLCEDSTGLLVGPSDRRLPHAGIYVSQIRGERYHEEECRAGDFSPGADVRLVREPDNEHDRYAVAVHARNREGLAGYVNKQKARALTKLLDNSETIEAISIRGTGAGHPCEQIAVLAARPDVVKHLLSPRPSSLPAPAHER